jgi:hypothetical protein
LSTDEKLHVPSHVFEEPEQILATARTIIADQLCSVWDWLPDEPEVQVLADQLSVALFAAVEGTYTQPLTLLKALIAPRPSEFHRGADVILIRPSIK